MHDMEEDIELDKFLLDADLLVCDWGSSILDEEVSRGRLPGLDSYSD